MNRFQRWSALGMGALLLLTACSRPANLKGQAGSGGTATGLSVDAAAIAKERGLTPADIYGALKTYVPNGKTDDAVMFASGGHAGSILAIGVPSMRIIKEIGVFSPISWEGWGYDADSKQILDEGKVEGNDQAWGDTHHPNLSETDAKYDGQFLFINDKANARIAVIDLRDWKTKQIVKNPLADEDHGAAFVTPNTEYIIETTQYSAPLAGTQADLKEYKDKYRGFATFWKFDREKGRIDPSQSFAVELPPYWQDLCEAGRGPGMGYAFCNSINTEMYTGQVNPDDPHFEAGASANDRDYLHVINWQKAAELVKAGKAVKMNGMNVIPFDVSQANDLVTFVPEPKSPHGVDMTPKGDFAVVSGKLDPHVSIFNVQKIMDAIKNHKFETKDQFGFPVIKFEDALEAQIEVGLGPLHTQFDDQGYGYTSLFLDSAIARWSVGSERPQDGWKLIQKLPIQYNVGHLSVMGGDTAQPYGKYLVALNKWSLDRFTSTGPLLPQNLQLIDISKPGNSMQVLTNLPIGMAEPHYAQIIPANLLKSWPMYPDTGWDPNTQTKSNTAVTAGQEKVVRTGPHEVNVYMTAVRSHFTPEHVDVQQGDHVYWHVTNIDHVKDATHGFGLAAYNTVLSIEPGETVNFDFVANKVGTFSWYCTEFCSALHLEMTGYLQVKPAQ